MRARNVIKLISQLSYCTYNYIFRHTSARCDVATYLCLPIYLLSYVNQSIKNSHGTFQMILRKSNVYFGDQQTVIEHRNFFTLKVIISPIREKF